MEPRQEAQEGTDETPGDDPEYWADRREANTFRREWRLNPDNPEGWGYIGTKSRRAQLTEALATRRGRQ